MQKFQQRPVLAFMEIFVGPLHLSTHHDSKRGFTSLTHAGDAPAAAKPTGNVEDTPHQRHGLPASRLRIPATAITVAIRHFSSLMTAWIEVFRFVPTTVTKQEIITSFKRFLAEQAGVRPHVDQSDYATVPPFALQFVGLPVTRAATRLFSGPAPAPSNR